MRVRHRAALGVTNHGGVVPPPPLMRAHTARTLACLRAVGGAHGTHGEGISVIEKDHALVGEDQTEEE